MPPKIPPSAITISKQQARRFLVAHHRLAPPRKLLGKQGVIDYVRHVNCIQYDPINVVGQNPHLVLQSRIKGYKPTILDEALYTDRDLIDGFDKVMSIYPVEDWPYFARYRNRLGGEYASHQSTVKAAKLMAWVKTEIETRGPLSSLDLEEETRMEWWLSGKTRAVRIALDILFVLGDIVVHHRVGTRRYFDLSERVLPKKVRLKEDLHGSKEAYEDWHVLRRIGGTGIIRGQLNSAQWGGIGYKGWGGIRAVLTRLVEQGKVTRVQIEGVAAQDYFLRRADIPALEKAAKGRSAKAGAAFLAPLDNMLWDRDMLLDVFDFFYRWEVYVPEPKRQYGYYVLPVLYGDRLIARLDPAFDRRSKTFIIQNWWWQPGVDKKDEAMLLALQDCVKDFATYLNADGVKLGEPLKKNRFMKQIVRTVA